jgi:hypothetical protein
MGPRTEQTVLERKRFGVYFTNVPDEGKNF